MDQSTKQIKSTPSSASQSWQEIYKAEMAK